MHVHPHHSIRVESDLAKHSADDVQHRPGFSGNVSKRRATFGKIRRHQPGKVRVSVGKDDLAERRPWLGNQLRLGV